MDVDSDTPGPHQHTNGVSDQMNDDDSPIPPPHKTPSPPPKPAYDPEACKATGNKYFKARDYTRAVQEYTKGEESLLDRYPHFASCAGLANVYGTIQRLLWNLDRSLISPTEPLHTCPQINSRKH